MVTKLPGRHPRSCMRAHFGEPTLAMIFNFIRVDKIGRFNGVSWMPESSVFPVKNCRIIRKLLYSQLCIQTCQVKPNLGRKETIYSLA